MRRPLLLALLLALGTALFLAGFALRSEGGSLSGPAATGPSPGPYRGSEPPGDFRIPNLALRDYEGRLIRTQALRGKVVLVTFLDTACKTKCPIIAGEIGSGLRLLTQAERREVVPLAITVNPATDNPRSVRAFLHRHHALGELDFLLGSVQQLRPVWRSFFIVAAAETGNADIHSADVRVFDRSGRWVSTLHAGVDLTPVNLARDLRAAGRWGTLPARRADPAGMSARTPVDAYLRLPVPQSGQAIGSRLIITTSRVGHFLELSGAR